MPIHPNRIFSFILLLALVAAVSAISCIITKKWMNPCTCEPPVDELGWMSKQLQTTPEQEKKIDLMKSAYAEQKRHGEALMMMANRELAQAILEDKQDSEKVRAAVDKIHHAMGGLQKETLNHLFEMKNVLRPEQYEKLLQFTSQGLNQISNSGK